jgi:hypothetical protein
MAKAAPTLSPTPSNWLQLGGVAAKLNHSRPNHFHRRHYEAIAQAMQDAIRCNGIKQMECVISILADLFAADNGEFKRDRFERACVPGANVRART